MVLGQVGNKEPEINSLFQKFSNSQIYLTLRVFRKRSGIKEAAEGLSAVLWGTGQ